MPNKVMVDNIEDKLTIKVYMPISSGENARVLINDVKKPNKLAITSIKILNIPCLAIFLNKSFSSIFSPHKRFFISSYTRPLDLLSLYSLKKSFNRALDSL